MGSVEAEYRARVATMSVAERVQRADAMFRWTREYLVRELALESGQATDPDLRWKLALRQYGRDPRARALIEELRARDSD